MQLKILKMLLLADKTSEKKSKASVQNCQFVILEKMKKKVQCYFRPTTWQEFKYESKVPETRGLRMQAGCRGNTMISLTAEI